MKRLAMLFFALLFASSANATQDGVAIHGFDDMSCGAWVSSTGNDLVRAQYLSWFRGFVSGVNFADSNHQIGLGQMPSNETLSLYIDKYCREKPLGSFPGAAFQLVRELRGQP
jgi:hypothetical protein